MADVRNIRGREFAKNVSAMKREQSRQNKGRRGRSGQALRSYFTTDNSNTRSRMRTLADLRQMPIDDQEMLYKLWEIVRTM